MWNYIRNLPQNLWRRKTNLRSNPMFYVKFPIRTGLAWKIRPNHFILRDCGDQWAVFIMEWCSWLVTRIRKYDLKVLHKHLARNVLFRRTMCTIHVFAHKRDVKERFFAHISLRNKSYEARTKLHITKLLVPNIIFILYVIWENYASLVTVYFILSPYLIFLNTKMILTHCYLLTIFFSVQFFK